MATQYYTASSLDGFIATPSDSLEWLFQLGDINDTGYPEFISDVGALAMGSSTYQCWLQPMVETSGWWAVVSLLVSSLMLAYWIRS